MRSLQVRETIPLVRVVEAMMMSMVTSLRTSSSTRSVSHSRHIHDNMACGLVLCLEAHMAT